MAHSKNNRFGRFKPFENLTFSCFVFGCDTIMDEIVSNVPKVPHGICFHGNNIGHFKYFAQFAAIAVFPNAVDLFDPSFERYLLNISFALQQEVKISGNQTWKNVYAG